MTDKLREAAKQALNAHGCERLKDFYECGPVQRAAVETFLEAALAAQAQQQQGYVLVKSGALQMVINALRRDASEGRVIRGEMADELLNAAHTLPAQEKQS